MNTVTTYKIKDVPLQKIIFWLNENALDNNKHYKNYDNFSLKDTIAVTLIQNKNTIIGMSTIMERDFWPNNYYRVLSRYFIDPKHRAKHQKNLVFYNRSLEMIKQQISFLQENKFKIKTCFLSMHSYKPRRARSTRDLLNKTTLCNWKNEDFMKVANGKSKACYQHIIYTGERPDFKIIEKDEWESISS